MRPDGRKLKPGLLALFLGGGSGLRGLRLGQALLEFIHAASRINELLRAGVKGVADVANTKKDGRLGRAGLDNVPAGAAEFRFLVSRMNVSFHNKGWIT